MIYGERKIKTMVKSILPSTARKLARKEKALAKRRARRSIRATLSTSVNHDLEELYDDPDLLDYPEIEINQIKDSRRGADKIPPIRRWATAITEDLRIEDRLSYIRSLVPKDVIGEHAISHLIYNDHFRNPNDPISFWRRPSAYRDPKALSQLEWDFCVRVLDEALTHRGLHRLINRTMRYRHKWALYHEPTFEKVQVIDPETGAAKIKIIRGSRTTRTGLGPIHLVGIGHTHEFVEKAFGHPYDEPRLHYHESYTAMKEGRFHPEWKETLMEICRALEEIDYDISRSFEKKIFGYDPLFLPRSL